MLFTSIFVSWLEVGVFTGLEIGFLKGEPNLIQRTEVVCEMAELQQI